jgi:hypothetical protein
VHQSRHVRALTTACGGILWVLTLTGGAATADAQTDAQGAVPTYAGEPVVPSEFNGDVRDLPLPERIGALAPRKFAPPVRKPPGPLKVGPLAPEVQEAPLPGPLAPMPSPSANFAGLSRTDLCGGVQCGAGTPPDTNGDVGPKHYILAVNDAYAVYNKTGTLLASFTEDQLFSTSGSNPCNGDSFGDPVVLYDPLEDRWILTHFAFALDANQDPVGPFYQCIAASRTSDPVSGGWWLYTVRMDPGGAGFPPVGALNDYGKFGIWTDCLYGSFNEFDSLNNFAFIGTAIASFSKRDLYSGAPLTFALGFINNATDPFTMIPSNLRGRLANQRPPAGTPNYFVSESQTAFAFEVRKFTAGPNCGAGGSLGTATNVSQTAYTVPNGAIVPQPGTTNMLDAIGDRLMQKVQYRRIGTNESLWVAHNAGTAPVRMQWAQLNVTGGVVSTTPSQQQIYSPDTSLHRWMGSVAVDHQGNMALGYSTSNGTAPNFPSIAYSGRLAGDPANTLPQTEVQLIAGAGSQTHICGGNPCDRWGDYSAMTVDPVDDCTFWYTTEYYSSVANGAAGNWQTRIGSFKFPACTPIAQPNSGTDTIGLYRPSTNTFYLRNSNAIGGADITIPFGGLTDLPVVGDWDGDGITTIGLYRPSTNTFYLRNTNAFGAPDLIIPFGAPGDVPLVGDWDGNGIVTIGLYRPSTNTFYLHNSNAYGVPELVIPFGGPGDLPVVGDWDGNGTTTIGLYRPSTSTFYLRNSNTFGPPDLVIPFGGPGDLPVVGDWDGNGTTTVGIYRPSTSTFALSNNNATVFTTIPFGGPGDRPLAGDWNGLP